METPSFVRRRALRRLAFCLVGGAVWVALVVTMFAHDHAIYGPGLGAPLVPLLGVSLELITGVSFREMSRRWDSLRGWQRGVLGLGVVIIAFAAFILIGTAVAISLMH